MRESFLIFLTKYCSLISAVYDYEEKIACNKFIRYLNSQVELEDISAVKKLFVQTFKNTSEEHSLFKEPDLSVNFASPFLDNLTYETIQTLSLKDRIILILLVMDFSNAVIPNFSENTKFIEAIGIRFGLSVSEIADLWQLAVNPESLNTNTNILLCKPKSDEEIEKLEGSWIESNLPENVRVSNKIEIEELTETMTILFLERNKMFVIKCQGNQGLIIQGGSNPVCRFKILEPGSEIKVNNQSIIHYTAIKHKYLEYKSLTGIKLSLEKISYRHRKKKKGINELSITETSGQLIGILGKEGVGKSTLLELLAGRISPDTGNIVINEYNLKTNRYLLKSIIGYVPEGDLLFEELTVFDNLLLTARLFFSKLTMKDLVRKVNQMLEKLDLIEIKNTIVGSISEKNIQPGQRRILNIALELLREPKILLVDTPVYGLNTNESSKIIEILHEYSFGGNLVIAAIRQTNHFAFNMFDKLWIIDEPGYLIYKDACYKASKYFIKYLNIAGLEDISELNTAENILYLINLRISDASGKWGQRKISAEKWHTLSKENQKSNSKPGTSTNTPLPTGYIKLPNLETQFRIFSIRNFKVKFSNWWKIAYTLFAGPLLAFLLAFILREKTNSTYSFENNPNLPFYYYAAALISLFLGLVISANEIIKERNILSKEEYLEFSKFSYLNSKILYLFLISIIQTFLFVFTGNTVLGIKGMLISDWIILFSMSSFGVVLGLILSSYMNNLKSIYEKAIPVIIGFQLLFGAGIVQYKDMNLKEGPFVPVAGEIMVTRWAYEALLVEQFKENAYEKPIYPYDKNISTYSYYTFTLLPLLESYYVKCTLPNISKDSVAYYLGMLKNSLTKVATEPGIFEFEYQNKLTADEFDSKIASETKDYLTYLEISFYDFYEKAQNKKTKFIAHLQDSIGVKKLDALKDDNFNDAVAKLVQNNSENKSYKIYKNKIFQVTDPIFQKPSSDFGRAILFVPQKKFRGEIMDTIWFNITFIWLFTFLLYLILLTYQPSLFK